MMYPNYNPYQPMQMQTQSLIRVNGIDGARAYQMPANSTVALFDSNADLMYIKLTDGAGFPTIRTFKFEEIDVSSKKVDATTYVSREEMEEYVKQFIQQSTTTDNATSKQSANANDKSIMQ